MIHSSRTSRQTVPLSVVVSVVAAYFGIVLHVNQRRNGWPSAVIGRAVSDDREEDANISENEMKGGPQVNLPILSEVICPLLGLGCV